jgi:hypothetical protein
MSSTAAARNSSTIVPINDTPWVTSLQAWLVIGSGVLICVPAARGIDPWFGWLPFWLVVAPAIDLFVLRRGWLATDAARWVERFRQRRRRSRRQAAPLRRAGVRHFRRTNHETHGIR